MSMVKTVSLSESLEDYLEAIFRITQEKSATRAKDISKRLKVGKSSVTGALHALACRQLINYAPYDVITLTAKGRAIAKDIARRHEVLQDFFVKVLAVNEKDANATACRMEHAISESVLEQFVEFIEYVERCPRGGTKWLNGFRYYCDHNKNTGNCEKCVESTLKDIRKKNSEKTAGEQAATSLKALRPGQKAAIVKVTGSGSIRRRLLDMGATAGTIVEVERVAPLGDPIEVKIKGYHLTLRKDEAERISVERL